MNTDFSPRISLVQKHNSTNTVICSKSKRTIPLDSRTVGKEKYSPVVLLYGGISFRSLIPTDSPIFIDDWLKSECQNIDKKKITMDQFLCIDLDQVRL